MTPHDDPKLTPRELTPSTETLFERAVQTHSRRLLAIARAIVGNRASAEDVLQQAVLNLFQHRDRYDWTDPGPLMRRSVVNEALRLLRQPRMGVVADDYPGVPLAQRSPASDMMDAEATAKVRAAIDALPDHFRAALVLCEYENMSYVQIAEVLGASVPQVKTWLHRGRRQLAAKLKDYMDPNAADKQADK